MSVSDQSLISISVVSHGQRALVERLLTDIGRCCTSRIEVILTLNIEEPLVIDGTHFRFPVHVIRNASPKGFGANHNAAFSAARGEYFLVVNPDIRLSGDPFPALMACVSDSRVGVVAPLVRNVQGGVEDSARRFPRVITPFLRWFGVAHGPDYADMSQRFEPDWVGGMFMFFPSSVFAALDGFDERYFLYYEDVDLCARLRIAGYRVVLEPQAVVLHEARRDSHRKLRYLRWHLRSALRFFTSPVYRRIRAGLVS